jgi:hypothetical protein
MPVENKPEKALTTIFDIPVKERQKAMQSLISGKTPINEIRQRPIRGGGTANYVNTYYMTRQVGLITGFRWTSTCLEERILEREIGVRMRVTIFDKDGNAYSQEAWGQKDIARYTKDSPRTKDNPEGSSYKKGDAMSLFDDLKSAYSDGIKKCLSYFGIANDVYGGKELDYFGDDNSIKEDGSPSGSGVTLVANATKRAFDKYITDIGLRYSDVFKLLGITSMTEITNYKDAYMQLKAKVESDGNET